MVLSVRKKIWLGTGFLFLLLLLTGGAGIYSTVFLKQETKTVIRDNYESLSYCHIMQQQVDSFNIVYNQALLKFEKALRLQEDNVTEPGEANATNNLQISFNKLKAGDTTVGSLIAIKNNIQEILRLNMNAIYNKNFKAQHTASNTLTLIITLATLLLLIAFTFSVNFPSIVTRPISEISDAIKEIANKNYKHRINIDNKDEFGQLAKAFNEMAERLQYFESSSLNKLMFEKARAEAVINSLKDASIGIDKDGIILFVNYQALQLLGLKAEEVIGKSVKDVSDKNDLFRYLVENESSAPFKIVVENRENYFIKEVVEVKQGETNNRVIVLRNITSFKELDVAKNNFIATISHELKTPLASSDFSLKLLDDKRVGVLTNEQKELIENLRNDNKRMLKILSELLNMSQVEAGKIQLNMTPVKPDTIIENAIHTISTSAREKNIEIEKIVLEHLPIINVDAEKTTWVLNNLLTNAIKYSQQNGKVTISVKVQDDKIIFSVSDNGPGIAKEHQNRVFERYFQVPGSKEKGTGLGLAISKDFIDAQGGHIWVASETGQGANFKFSLPIVR